MADILLSGPAGAGKSQRAAALLRELGELAVLVDFQAIYAALTGDVRGPDGRYPLRKDQLLPLVEYLRRAAIGVAVRRGITVVATNSATARPHDVPNCWGCWALAQPRRSSIRGAQSSRRGCRKTAY